MHRQLRTSLLIAAATITLLAPRPARAQAKSDFALCLQTDVGVKFYLNFVTQGAALMVTGREGAAGFPDPTGVLTGGVLLSNVFHGFPTTTAAAVTLDIAVTSLFVNNPMDVPFTSANTVFTFPLPFTGTGTYRRTTIPGGAGSNGSTSGAVHVCAAP